MCWLAFHNIISPILRRFTKRQQVNTKNKIGSILHNNLEGISQNNSWSIDGSTIISNKCFVTKAKWNLFLPPVLTLWLWSWGFLSPLLHTEPSTLRKHLVFSLSSPTVVSTTTGSESQKPTEQELAEREERRKIDSEVHIILGSIAPIIGGCLQRASQKRDQRKKDSQVLDTLAICGGPLKSLKRYSMVSKDERRVFSPHTWAKYN